MLLNIVLQLCYQLMKCSQQIIVHLRVKTFGIISVHTISLNSSDVCNVVIYIFY